MNNNWNSMYRSGAILTCGIIALAASADAKKPVPEPPPPAGPAYRIFEVGAAIKPNFYEPGDRGISDSGALVGSAWYEVPEEGRAFQTPAMVPPRLVDGEVSYHADDLRLLPDIDGRQEYGYCFAANTAGIAVGHPNDTGTWRALLWLADGTPVDLAVCPADVSSNAGDVNDAGIVLVGIGEIGDPGPGAGVVVPVDADLDGTPDTWLDDSDGNGINDLFLPIETGNTLMPFAINNSGQIVVECVTEGTAWHLLTPDSVDADGDGNPWYADVDGDGVNDLLFELEPFEPGAGVAVEGLNDAGQVVGRSGGHVLRWDFVDGVQVVTDLGSLADKLNMVPVGISDAGRITGRSWTQTGRRTKDGPAWLIDDGTVYEFLPLMVNPDGWSELEPRGINRHGWIQGIGALDGIYQNFVAIPVDES